MNNVIKPIETIYNGYKFRSRLEAKWAVFFNELNLRYEYEPEGFVLTNGEKYLPDFKVFGGNNIINWYEVKPKENPDCNKLHQFEKDYNKSYGDYILNFELLCGDPFDMFIKQLELIELKKPSDRKL